MTSRGAFVDSKGIRWDTSNADHEGWLTKKSKWLGSWRRRYFVLKGSKLFYGDSNTEPPHGVIDLVDCKSLKTADPKTKKNFAFEITLNDLQILVHAEQEKEKSIWISQLERAIKTYSSALEIQRFID